MLVQPSWDNDEKVLYKVRCVEQVSPKRKYSEKLINGIFKRFPEKGVLYVARSICSQKAHVAKNMFL